jgi:hypothetical protein
MLLTLFEITDTPPCLSSFFVLDKANLLIYIERVMGRPKKIATKTAPETSRIEPEQQTEAFVQREIDEPREGSKADRISLKLKDDGLVDWDSHRSDTKEKIVAALKNDPVVLRALGLGVPEGITEENAHAALKGLAQVDAILVSIVMKFGFKMPLDPPALEAFEFTRSQLDEMVPRAARIANKYATGAVLKYQDEIALVGMFGMYLSEQIKKAVMVQAMINAAKRARIPEVQAVPEGATNGKEVRAE